MECVCVCVMNGKHHLPLLLLSHLSPPHTTHLVHASYSDPTLGLAGSYLREGVSSTFLTASATTTAPTTAATPAGLASRGDRDDRTELTAAVRAAGRAAGGGASCGVGGVVW